jgi:hypothetical protein
MHGARAGFTYVEILTCDPVLAGTKVLEHVLAQISEMLIDIDHSSVLWKGSTESRKICSTLWVLETTLVASTTHTMKTL